MDSAHPDDAPYKTLTPDVILDAAEAAGIRTDGRFIALNSYENRVYQIGVDQGRPIVAKFYRPNRWSDDAILEEHAFAWELAEREIPVVPPLNGPGGSTLHHHAGFRYAIYPRQGGRWPELDDLDNLLWLGRFIGRIHAVGAVTSFKHRPTLTIENHGEQSREYLLAHGFIPRELVPAYESVARDLLARVRTAFDTAGAVRAIRLHGDCHPGNILWTDQGPHFVDLDDCRMGPAVQDLWMLLSGERQDRLAQVAELLEGYVEFADFDSREVQLVEALRSLRMMHYAAWLARRWHDPAFPLAFPWFNTQRYWQDHVLALREQLSALDEPALTWR